jgi:Mrp family chromosome partitioning ATPase
MEHPLMIGQLRLPAPAFLDALAALLARHAQQRRSVRHERELVAALGEPLLAAHPFSASATQALARQLADYWFVGGRTLLPIVGVRGGEGPAALACQLARTLADEGLRALLVDADLRSPRLHARFGVPRGKGLADYLDVRGMESVTLGANLTLLSAGTLRDDPLELLSRARLRRLLAALASRFDALLVAAAPASRGPDFEIFAALAGGALVFMGEDVDAAELASLRQRLARCAARVVGTVLERR